MIFSLLFIIKMFNIKKEAEKALIEKKMEEIKNYLEHISKESKENIVIKDYTDEIEKRLHQIRCVLYF